jgi:hypothetical protein
MLCPRLMPLNRRPTVQNLPNPHRKPSREAGSFPVQEMALAAGRFAPNIAVQPMTGMRPCRPVPACAAVLEGGRHAGVTLSATMGGWC